MLAFDPNCGELLLGNDELPNVLKKFDSIISINA